jgi:hypothetical protein
MAEVLLEAWQFHGPPEIVAAVSDSVAGGTLGPPDLRCRLISSAGTSITVQVVDGGVPQAPDALLFVRGWGAYALLRREAWPGGRVLLTLVEWPER